MQANKILKIQECFTFFLNWKRKKNYHIDQIYPQISTIQVVMFKITRMFPAFMSINSGFIAYQKCKSLNLKEML